MPSNTRAGLSSVLCGACCFESEAGRPAACAATAEDATLKESRATTNARVGDIDVRSEMWAAGDASCPRFYRTCGSRTTVANDGYAGLITR